MKIKKDQKRKEEQREKQKKSARKSKSFCAEEKTIPAAARNHSGVIPISTPGPAVAPLVASAGVLSEPAALLEPGLGEDSLPEQKLLSSEENVFKDYKNQYLYVYGIMDKVNNTDDNTNNIDITLNLKGLKEASIAQINFKDLVVLFSFYPVLHPLIEEKEALHHAEILNKIAEKVTIIPMAFGTVFKDREILEVVLEKAYPQARKTLELIKDKMELGIKVVKKGAAEELAEETLTAVHQEILEELNKLSVKSIAGDKFSDRLLLNNSFLVEKQQFINFSDKVGELEEKHQNVKFLYTGPWPAYSFVDINIKVG